MRVSVFVRNYTTKKNEKRFYLIVRESGRRDQTLHLGPVGKKIAEQRRVMVLNELLSGTYQRVSSVRLFFGEFCDKFLTEYAAGIMAPSTLSLYRDRLKKVRLFFENYRLDEIRREDIEIYLSGLKLAGRSKNIILSILRHVFQKAVDWRYLAKSPAYGIRRQREESVGSRSLTETELGRLLDMASPWQLSILKVMVFTGMRAGELSRLKFKDIDWENHNLTIVSDHDRKTKNRKKRIIPMTGDLEETLQFLRENCPNTQYGNGGMTTPYLPRTKEQMEYVFCHSTGRPVGTFGPSIRKLLRRAGIEGVSIHGFRKTFCSLLARRGVHIKAAQKLMGHSDGRLTLDIYTEIQDDQLQDAVASLPSVRELQKTKLRVVGG